MQPSKFTPMELDSLIKEAISRLESNVTIIFLPALLSTTIKKTKVGPFFPPAILDRVKIVDLLQTKETIPYPPFYETVRAGGDRVLPDAAHMTAMPFGDLIAFNREPTLRTLFHNLVHVTQFVLVGTDRVMKGYFETLNEAGLWMVVPFEEQAYQLDARYTRNPLEVFSVEDEVREWMRTGRY